jgi:rubrerythrin
MALTDLLSIGWRQFLTALQSDQRQRLLEVLHDEYTDEAKDVVQFEEHARRITYPHYFRERLLRIAEEEKAHVKWLQDKIQALGGEIPQTTFTVKNGKNSWESLLMDVEEEKRDSTSRLEQLYTVVEPADPEITAGLRRIREDEKRHREEIMDLLLKSDPYALPHPTTEHVQREKQKQAWLEQQKMEWLAKRQAEWEAAGKPTPWAEWIREREFAWEVTELPNRELVWTIRLTKKNSLT